MSDPTDTTPHLDLPLIAAAQAQKHVTMNEALVALDALAQIAVASRTAVPAEPFEHGLRHIVPTSSDDLPAAWAGHEGEIAAYGPGGWRFHQLANGFVVWVEDENALLVQDGSGLTPIQAGGERTGRLGIGTDADATNRLAVASPATLLTHAGDDHRLAVNRAGADDTASLVFQTDYRGTAEIGLAGDDALAFKVADAADTWRDALTVDPATGEIAMPHSQVATGALVNLMSDGGRLAGAPEPAATAVGDFERPSWLGLWSGTTFERHATFHRNSTTYGGNAPALDADVRALVETIYEPDPRRFALEFHVARITTGPGGAPSTYADGVTRGLQCYTLARPRPVRATFSFYFKVVEGDVALGERAERIVHVDGVPRDGDFVVADDAWHHCLTHDGDRPAASRGYSTSSISLYAAEGSVLLFALPALVAGHVHLPGDIGYVSTAQHW